MLFILLKLYKTSCGLDFMCHIDAVIPKNPAVMWCDDITPYQNGVRVIWYMGLTNRIEPTVASGSDVHIPGPYKPDRWATPNPKQRMLLINLINRCMLKML